MAASAALPLNDFLSQGLMEANSLLLLDLEKCTRCDNCVRACADAHDGVTRLIREGLRYRKLSGRDLLPAVPRSSLHGRLPGRLHPPPQFARSRDRRLVHRLRPCAPRIALTAISTCTRSRSCWKDIPMPAGALRPVIKHKATSCDLCTEHAEPSCVYACPHDAAHRVDPNEFFKLSLPRA